MNTPPLSDMCLAVLEHQDCYAEPSGPNSYSIRDSDGGFVCAVTAGIAAGDLQSIFFHAERVYRKGIADGRRALQAHLREMLNAAPLEPTE